MLNILRLCLASHLQSKLLNLPVLLLLEKWLHGRHGLLQLLWFIWMQVTHTHTKIGTKLIWPSTFMLLGNRLFHEAFYYFSNIVYFHYSDYKGCIEKPKNEKVNYLLTYHKHTQTQVYECRSFPPTGLQRHRTKNTAWHSRIRWMQQNEMLSMQ